MPDVFKVADILVSHSVRAHGDEIAIIAYYGSYATGNASAASDLDVFYIPDDGRAGSLSTQFVFDGLPYDFWPVSWELAERISNANHCWSAGASMIADAQVLHHRSREDLARFNALKSRIAKLASSDGRETMVARALEEFKNTLFQLGQIRLAIASADSAGIPWACWRFANSALNCVALVNQKYFTRGWGANKAQITALPARPDRLAERLEQIVLADDPNAAAEAAESLAVDMRGILLRAQAETAKPSDVQSEFRDFYFFVFEYVNKVLAACKRNDPMAAASAAFLLQEEICGLLNKVENGFTATEFNLLGEYIEPYHAAGFADLIEAASAGDLPELARRASMLDEQMCRWLQGHGVELNILGSEEELRQLLIRRDPAKPSL